MLDNREGKRVPDVTFRVRDGHQWVDVSTDDVFKGKTVVVFSLPGAFTPTCSSTHVPRYNQLAPEFKAHGVDDIVCVSVNDSFVMNQWQREQKAFNLTFLPDGNGDFTRAMDMLVKKDDLGFVERSWRYSMLVRDGVIENMLREPKLPGVPFENTDADTLFRYIGLKAALPHNVTVFSHEGCEYCVRTKGLLAEAGIAFVELVLNRDLSEATVR